MDISVSYDTSARVIGAINTAPVDGSFDEMDETYVPGTWESGTEGYTWFIETADWNWGKGRTLFEAARNASVGSTKVECNVMRFPNMLVNSVDAGDINGCQWEWSDAVDATNRPFCGLLQAMCQYTPRGRTAYIHIQERTKKAVITIGPEE